MDVHRARTVKAAIFRLSYAGVDSASLALGAERLLRSVIPFDRSCWHNVDPATAMVTSVIGESAPSDPALPLLEYATIDVNHYADLAHAKPTVAALRQATDDEPGRSRRYREILSCMGIEDELTASFVVDSTFWGCARLYRSGRWPPFDTVEVAFVASVCAALAEGFRTALLTPGLTTHAVPDGPGVLVLDDRGRVESITAGAERWLQEVVDVVPSRGGPLPHPVYAVAARARAIGAGAEAATQVARCRLPMRSGGWLVLHGAQLQGGPHDRTAVIVEPAAPAELAPLIVRAYGLTERERQVTESACQGLATKQIARALGVSPYTVSDHLRAVFEKVGVNSRTELAARIFFDQYYPRVGRGATVGIGGWFMEA